MTNWQPPETAPRDGRVFRAIFKNIRPNVMCKWSRDLELWEILIPSDYGYVSKVRTPEEMEVWAEI